MPADKLGQFMKSPEFLRRCNAAVERAVRGLEARGIKPVYIERQAIDVSRLDVDAQQDRGGQHQRL